MRRRHRRAAHGANVVVGQVRPDVLARRDDDEILHRPTERRIADAGQYPAIDVEVSVSRVMQDITDAPWREQIRKLRRLIAAYNAQRDLIAIGAYQRGSDPVVDEATARWPAIQQFLGQDVSEAANVESSRAALERVLADA